MIKQRILTTLVSGAIFMMTGASQAVAASTGSDSFRTLSDSVAGGSLPESSPLLFNSNWTGINADNYLSMPFKTNSAGVQRIDLQNPYNTRTVTLVAPDTQSFVSSDASRRVPWGMLLTTEESWDVGSTKDYLSELVNPITAIGMSDSYFVPRSVISHIAHEGLALDELSPNVAYVNVQHSSSSDDRTIVIAVPEPETYAMLLIGFGLIGASAHRKKTSRSPVK